MKTEDALKIFNTHAEMARALDLTSPTVFRWKGEVPRLRRVHMISAMRTHIKEARAALDAKEALVDKLEASL